MEQRMDECWVSMVVLRRRRVERLEKTKQKTERLRRSVGSDFDSGQNAKLKNGSDVFF